MYQLRRKQLVKTDIDTCWQFFSSPKNLEVITPSYLNFRVLTEVPNEMYEGLLISYKVSPLFNVPLNWVTEITHVKEGEFFVDEQRIGPYTLWHHEHHFKKVEDGIEMIDIVSYVLPFGWFGRLAHRLFLRKQIEGIFEYRQSIVDSLFPS
jgi:ligand-binding SRPBCC domain-containing protein